MKKISFVIKLLIIIGFLGAISVFAAEQYKLLEPIPYYGSQLVPGEGIGLSTYLEAVFAFGISIAGILAVAMIVIGGIQYMTAYGNSSAVENAKDRITQALLGLLLAVAAWLILYTINPDLAKGKLTVPPIPTQSISQIKNYG